MNKIFKFGDVGDGCRCDDGIGKRVFLVRHLSQKKGKNLYDLHKICSHTYAINVFIHSVSFKPL